MEKAPDSQENRPKHSRIGKIALEATGAGLGASVIEAAFGGDVLGVAFAFIVVGTLVAKLRGEDNQQNG